MSACFQACGTEPVVNDAFINLQSDGAISTAHSFKMRGGRWSGPGDLNAFRFFICITNNGQQLRINHIVEYRKISEGLRGKHSGKI